MYVHALKIASEPVNVGETTHSRHFGAKSSLVGSLHDIKQNYAKAVASCFPLTIFKLELGQEVTQGSIL